MSEYLNYAAFGLYPYIALAVFLIGSLVRYDRDPYTWRSGSSQLLRKRQFAWGSYLFHIGIIGLFLGHLVGLLTPIVIFDAIGISHAAKQMLAIVAGGIFGIMCFAGLTLLIHRRLTDSRIRATSTKMDIFILFLLYAQLILGLISIPISLGHPEGDQMMAFMLWAQKIVTFQGGAAELVTSAHWVFKLHIFLGLTVFLVFPFSRLVHIWSAPFGYLTRNYQVVRSRKAGGAR
ncbi:respiratory nitrate reductase subunit gamma [Fodinicurvata sediminis]|uniref:respiratory nitrate reductase subunit gamma n=1 Tax=Fodinicurvata sediminis TaxID=1121832 RepID=UPI0003B60D08|nr:respiratory nitrate reductase subunit gamma [Fodinicurvata sediminis]